MYKNEFNKLKKHLTNDKEKKTKKKTESQIFEKK